uniref:Putative ovule protein n=1 Tax=Solanum chacoense TaxID=4108 RepID=A0A0V0GZ62_SOLCH
MNPGPLSSPKVFENAGVVFYSYGRSLTFVKILMIKMSNILEIEKTSFSFSQNILLVCLCSIAFTFNLSGLMMHVGMMKSRYAAISILRLMQL